MISGPAPGSERPRGLHGTETDPESVTALLGGVWRSLLAEVGGTAELLVKEGRLAALSLTTMVGLALASVTFVFATWLALAAALAVWLVGLGYSPVGVLLGVAAGNLLLAWLAWLSIRALSRNLLFRRTRHRLESREAASGAPRESGSHALSNPHRA